jgi:hypothetical protein
MTEDVFALLIRCKNRLRTEASSGARVSAHRLSSAIFFDLTASLSSPSCPSRRLGCGLFGKTRLRSGSMAAPRFA